jgi:hypothetical protein
MDTQINSKNFESNKLINPDIIEDIDDDDNDDELIDELPDEMDDETLELINRVRIKQNNYENNTLFIKPEPIKKINKKSVKNNKNMTLQEFNKILENDKPLIKKFTSNRVETKKKNDNINITIKRHFNPRKPPYNFNRKNIIIDIPQINNIKQFPELK